MGNLVEVNSGRFDWNGHQIAYEKYGSSGTPLVLIHGLLLDTLIYRNLARIFAKQGFHVVLLDLLGHGRSDKPTDPREHRIDFYADQVLACMDHLTFEKAVIGGMSLGAITSLQAAAKAPHRCIGLFLEMPVMEWSTTFAAMLLVPLLTGVDYFKWAYRPFARLLRRLPLPKTDWMASGINAIAAEPEVIRAVLHGILVGPVVPAAAVRRQLAMPTLIIGHGGDRLHSWRDAVALAREMPNAKLLKANSLIELRRKPERLWADIQSFLEQVREPAKASGASKKKPVSRRKSP